MSIFLDEFLEMIVSFGMDMALYFLFFLFPYIEYRINKKKKCSGKPQRIILIRHAESLGNVDHKVYGKTPDHKISLTKKGKENSEKVGKELKKIIGNEKVFWFVSPYKRSMQTFKYLAKAFGGKSNVKWRQENRIREQEWGNFQDPKTIDKTKEERKKFGSFFYRFAKGESGADVYNRVSLFLDSFFREIAKRKHKNVVLVSHGYTLRCILARWYYLSVDQLQGMWNPRNLEYFIMEKQGNGKYTIKGKFRANEGVFYPKKMFSKGIKVIYGE